MRRALSAALGTSAALLVAVGLLAGPAQAAETLKVGTVLPLNFGLGVDTKKALEMLVEELNASGGLTAKGKQYKVELIVYDDKWKAEEGRAAVERLLYQDKVKHVVGMITSPSIVSALSLFENEKVLNFCSGSTPKILNAKLRYTFGLSTTRTSVPPLWMMVKKIHPNAKTVVFLSPNDEGGKARAAEEKQVAEAFGVKVLDVLTYQREAVDFTALAAKAVSLKPDLIDYPGADPGTQFGLQVKAVYAAGFRGGQITAIPPKLNEVAAVSGQEALEGLLLRLADTELPEPPPPARTFKDAYTKKYGKWSDAMLPWIAAWYAWVEAVKKADSVDPTVIADHVAEKGLEWQRVDGKARMVRRPDMGNSQYCDSVAELGYGRIKGGKIVPVGRLAVDEVITANERVFGGGSWK
jgi:branched-chain amino acid transport system substrate-binding protein